MKRSMVLGPDFGNQVVLFECTKLAADFSSGPQMELSD